MKLSEALDFILTKVPGSSLGPASVPFHAPEEFLELRLATLGESRWESWLGDLQHTRFGLRYWESQSRGGGYSYLLPVKDLEKEEDWFSYFGNNPQVVEDFHLPEGYEWMKTQEPRYQLVRANDAEAKLQCLLSAALTQVLSEASLSEVLAAMEQVRSSGQPLGAMCFQHEGDASELLTLNLEKPDH